MAGELAGQVAIATGGGRGIGRVIAQALAGAGAAVAVTARSGDQVTETAALIEAAGGRALAIAADVTDQAAVERLVDDTERRLGPVTLLVNNAAIFAALGPSWEVDPAEWWRTVEVNLRGTFLASRAVLPRMIARRRGRIINVAGGGIDQPAPEASAYGVSKVAVVRFTDSLAAEAAPYGVQVFVVQPGPVQTEMGKQAEAFIRAHAEAGKYGWTAPPTGWAVPWNPPERTAEVCVFLASGQGDGLSGRYISAGLDDVRELGQRAEVIQQKDLYALRIRK